MRNLIHPFAAILLAGCVLAVWPFCGTGFAEQEAQVVDGIAAVVNGEVITFSQVRALSAPREKLLRSQFTGKDLEKKLIELRMIMIPGQKDTASAPAQKALAEEVLGKLAGGAEFDRTAQVYSEDSTRDNGGDWGWIERNTLAGPLEKIAFNMPVGRISNIIDYAGNYYILKVEDKQGGTTKSLAEARSDIEKKLLQEEAQQIQERWIASLREKAYIKTF